MTSNANFRAAAIIAGLLVLGSAQAQATKPGLWEIQSRTQVDGQAMPDMADMMKDVPPEMRAQMKAMLEKQGVGMAPTGLRVCITPEQAARDDIPVQGDNRCKTTWKSRGQRATFHVECANPPSKGDGEMEIIGPEAWKTRMNMQIREQGQLRNVRTESQGKWLSSKCGNIKPVTLK